ncbi:Hypothetical protein A7982_02681 [Minicystis rosea]|nr:Hypothetical protein A7982_02681 [Minicystis rosea]
MPSGRDNWLNHAFVRAIAVAALLHLPLFPSRVFDWVRLAFSKPGDYDDADAQAVVPVDLDLLSTEPVAEPPAPAPPAPAPPPVPAAGPGDEAPDAGAPRARPDAGAPPPDGGAPPPDAGAPRPAPSVTPKPAGPATPAPVRDPMAAAGSAGKIAAKDPNVQFLLSGRAMRKHALGAFFSRILLMVPEWHQFFQDTPVDPIRDFDHLLITAPRLRGDSGKMVAIMETNISGDAIHAAVGQVIHQTNGVWIEDAPVTAARAKVGGAHRIFALLPEKRLLVILPGDASDQLEKLKQAKGFRNSAEAIVVSVLTPARPFGTFFPLPESLKWMRLSVIPTTDGGVDLAIDAGDRSAELAVKDAEAMTKELERRRKIDVLGLTSVEILSAFTFTADGETIRGRTHVTSVQLRQIMAFVETQAQQRWGAAPRGGRTEH